MRGLGHKLNVYTGLSSEMRAKSLRWLSRQSEIMILEAFVKQKDHYFRISNQNENNRSLLYLAALYTSAHELYRSSKQISKKNRDGDIQNLECTTTVQALKYKKFTRTPKMERMLDLKNKIFQLKNEEKLSYREISSYLFKYHRLAVSHTYIATFFQQIKD